MVELNLIEYSKIDISQFSIDSNNGNNKNNNIIYKSLPIFT